MTGRPAAPAGGVRGGRPGAAGREPARADKDLLAEARRRTREILEGPPPAHIHPEVDRAIRKRFPIQLPPRV